MYCGLKLQTFTDHRGSLRVLDQLDKLPFEIQRLYLLESKNEEVRGEHGHYECDQLLVVLDGKISYREIMKNNCENKIDLKTGATHLISKGIWHSFKSVGNSVCLVLASHPYDIDDYFYDIGGM